MLFPLAGAAGDYDAAKRSWTLTAAGPPPLSIEVAVVHVAPTTQVVLRLSAAAKTTTCSSERSFQVRFADTKVDPPLPEKKFDDPLVAAVRFSGDTATIEFREPNLTARAYPLTGPDRLVIEVGRKTRRGRGARPSRPRPRPGHSRSLTIVVDPGHGGTETGAIGPGGLQEKEATLEIARRLAATLPRVLACRTVLTRDTDVLISLDDRPRSPTTRRRTCSSRSTPTPRAPPPRKGSETYYLSLEASDKIAQEVAQRGKPGGAARRRRAGGCDRQPRPRLHPLGPRPERAPEGVERARRGDPGRAERRLGHRQPRHQAGALPRPRRRDDAGGPRRGRVHLERRGGEEAEEPRSSSRRSPTPSSAPSSRFFADGGIAVSRPPDAGAGRAARP